MKKKKQLYFLVIILALLIKSCVSEFNADLPYEDSQILIVDGSIVGGDFATFYVGKSFSLDEKYTPAIHAVDAKLVVTGDNGYISKEAISMGDGYYRLYIDPLEDDVAYSLKITTASGEVYESLPGKPLKTPPIDSLSFNQPDGNDVHFYISTHDTENKENADYFFWTYRQDWEVKAHYSTEVLFNPADSSYYEGVQNLICWGKETKQNILIGSTEALSENRLVNHDFLQETATHKKFEHLFRITVEQKSISREAYQYYKSKRNVNEEMDGLFTPQPSEVEGNIECITNPDLKVIGYVDVVKNISQQTLFIYSYELSRTVYTPCAYLSSMNWPFPPGFEAKPINFYRHGYRPVAQNLEIDVIEWAPGECVDCVIAGGNLTKPEGWPRY
jgi:hypothetical protein